MDDCDLLVIGAGSAGSVIAGRLSADPARRVTVLEAGTRVDDPDMRKPERWTLNYGRSYDWAYWTTTQPGLGGRRLDWPRGKGIGGSSLLHAMAHMRGCRTDYDAWVEATGDDRWSWDGLLPFFIGMERYSEGAVEAHGDRGPLPVLLPGPELFSPVVGSYLEAWASLGVARIPDHNRGEMLGATPNSLTIENGRRVTVSDAYLDPALERPNLRLIDRALVHRLLFEGEKVVGAEVERDGRMHRIRAEQTVLAGGSLADVMLLQRSGVGDPADLAAAGVEVRIESTGVGKNLHDHLLGAGNVYRARREVPPSRTQVSESMTYLSSADPRATTGAGDVVIGCVIAPSTSADLAGAARDVPMGSAYTLLFGVTNPTSRGSMRISGPDVGDEPILDPNYLDTEHDRESFRRALALAREVGATDAMAEWRAEELLPGAGRALDPADADDFVRRSVITHHHPCGTLRMGSDESAPVTPELRLRGVENCWVADAAVIPAITTGPIHAAVLAIAESFAARYPA